MNDPRRALGLERDSRVARCRRADHARAVAVARQIAAEKRPSFITNYIEVEAHALLLRKLDRSLAREWLFTGGLSVVRAMLRDEQRADVPRPAGDRCAPWPLDDLGRHGQRGPHEPGRAHARHRLEAIVAMPGRGPRRAARRNLRQAITNPISRASGGPLGLRGRKWDATPSNRPGGFR